MSRQSDVNQTSSDTSCLAVVASRPAVHLVNEAVKEPLSFWSSCLLEMRVYSGVKLEGRSFMSLAVLTP